jgi:hypothetical protein
MTAQDTGLSLAILEDRTGKLEVDERMAGLLIWFGDGCDK